MGIKVKSSQQQGAVQVSVVLVGWLGWLDLEFKSQQLLFTIKMTTSPQEKAFSVS